MNINERLVSLPVAMNTWTWGPHYWRVFHTATEWYRTQTARRIPHFDEAILWLFYNIPTILPCEVCSAHAREFISENMLNIRASVGSSRSPAEFMNGLHNHANTTLNKPIVPYAEFTPEPDAAWADSFWTFLVTQAAALPLNFPKISTTVDLFEKILPFLVPNTGLALQILAYTRTVDVPAVVLNTVNAEDDGMAAVKFLEGIRSILLRGRFTRSSPRRSSPAGTRAM